MHSVLKSLLLLGSVTLVSCGDDEGASTTTPDSGNDTSKADSGAEDESSSTAPSTSSNETTTEREGPEGCYLKDNHACDCSIESEAACDGVGVWTTGCNSCTEVPEDGGVDAQADDGSVPAATGPGCYDPNSHACDCDSNESACAEADGVWTVQCACPVADAATTDTSSESSSVTTTIELDSGTTSDSGTSSDSGDVDAEVAPDSGEIGDGAL